MIATSQYKHPAPALLVPSILYPCVDLTVVTIITATVMTSYASARNCANPITQIETQTILYYFERERCPHYPGLMPNIERNLMLTKYINKYLSIFHGILKSQDTATMGEKKLHFMLQERCMFYNSFKEMYFSSSVQVFVFSSGEWNGIGEAGE